MLDFKFLSSVLTHQEPGFLLKEKVALSIDKDAKPVFEFILNYFKEFNDIPGFDAVLEKTKVNLKEWQTDSSPEFYEKELIDRAIRVKILDASQKAQAFAQSVKEDNLNDRLIQVFEEALKDSRGLINHKNSIIEVDSVEHKDKRLKNFLARESRESFLTGIPTPWDELNDRTLGLQKGELITVIGTTNIGKTFFKCLMAECASAHNRKGLFGSLEMGEEPLILRIDAIHKKISPRDLKRADLTYFERENYIEYLKGDKSRGSIFVANPINIRTPSDLEAAVEEIDPDIVFVDSFYKMTYPGASNAIWEKVSDIVWSLKLLAEVRQIPVVISGQFGRQVRFGPMNSRGRRGAMQDASFSFALMQDSDIVISLNQNQQMAEEGVMEVRLLKMRNDETGEFYIEWDLDNMVFDSVDLRDLNLVDDGND